MRRGDPPPEASNWVVRGGALDPETLRLNANANHAAYGFYSISAWLAVDDDQVDALAATKLRGAWQITLVKVADVEAAELKLWDTGQRPHYDLVYGDGANLDALLAAAARLATVTLANEHYDAEGEER